MNSRLDLRGILVFVAFSFCGAWLINLPLWLNGKGLQQPLAKLLLPCMMLIPAAGVAVAVFLAAKDSGWVRLAGLRLGARGWWRYWAFCWLIIPLLSIAAPFVSAALGFYSLDVREFSGFREMIRSASGAAGMPPIPIRVLVALQLASVAVAPVLNAVFAFGEEIGWRGYLLPKLLPLGQWRALILTGVVWGLWHTPVILLGHNYPKHPVLGVFFMVAFCIIFGILFGWTRLATGSVWPAVIGHGALNGSAGAVFLFSKAGTEVDTLHAGITGWTGWILPVAVILVMAATRRIPVAGAPDDGPPTPGC